jgi:hypothetical protein
MGCKAFSNDQQNILADVISVAAGVPVGEDYIEENKTKIYDLLENTPYASLIVHISDALNSLGYESLSRKPTTSVVG